MRTVLAIIPHADDAALFCGATLAKRAAEGWRVVLARVTNDASDSVGLTREETIRRNAAEFRDAAAALGASEIEELGYETDTLADVSLVGLRERMVYLIRKHRPYAVFSFDPYASCEPNQDHVRTAQAVEEAFWVARFDRHETQHFEEGLRPFAVCEQWYYARRPFEPNWAEDVTDYVEKKIAAACAHRTMVAHIVHQCAMLLDAWDGDVPEGSRSVLTGDPDALLATALRSQAEDTAQRLGLGAGRAAEAFRVLRFGDMAGVFTMLGFAPAGNLPASGPPMDGVSSD